MSDLYELPNGWEWSKLKDVCNLLNGYAFKAKEYVEKSDTVIIRMGNIRPNGGFDAEHKIKYLPNKYKDELPNYILNDGDLIIAMTDLATEMRILGNPTLVSDTNGRTFMLNQRVGKLYDFKLDKVNIEYLRYILSANQIKDYYKSLGGGGLQINIGKQQILSVDFPLPPLSEQQRIVSKLDNLFEKIDKSIALHQKNMDEADVFMGSILNDVFGELEEKYGLVKINDTVLKTKNKNPKDDLEKPFTYIDISSIDNKLFKIVEPKQLVGSEAPSRAKKEVVLGDIVYSTTRPNLKNISIVSEEYDNPIASTGFCVLRVNDKTINSYLFYYLITDKLFEQIEPNIRGAQYPATSDKDLKNCNIPNTPLHIQQKVVKYLDEVSQNLEKVKLIQKEKMNSLKALKASILDKALRGEL